ncbi:hypothetical protein H6G54_24765 [Anabaena cylindrica FACHB-243]|uniref:Uncharacterized protein n=1 Tax=Anabaena cylindrica (strain ATCC 27899 / PCC 7122) TaxID=272123 RepID=K9ZDF0_ANACC|nr:MULTISPECIES: hypothetical protein [Anabaena]AFZ57186.1 hypothetical protein Anacy_1687 [Anabaena cylindrica PCC 7122]MBD2420856.1 hypothetical protein [Anabaena cylindrica FACHB-243]MBY5285603.1 hypothetical protein [Anabaena sp. CCAP 1446/1C]MBY5311725.1 hypothetical protein [Anabaena sp. CCAP 1446/1C]MCM2410055.1 hypothetical protein [Anabaena sp. CCAP 1446/1C]
MNIAKLILLACHVFFVSLLLVVSPAHASTKMKSAPVPQIIVIASAQPNPELIAPNLTPANSSIVDHIGCTCGTCVKANFQMLQGKLPAADFQ